MRKFNYSSAIPARFRADHDGAQEPSAAQHPTTKKTDHRRAYFTQLVIARRVFINTRTCQVPYLNKDQKDGGSPLPLRTPTLSTQAARADASPRAYYLYSP